MKRQWRRVIWMGILTMMTGITGAASAGQPQPATSDEIKQMISATGEAKDYDNAPFVYVLDESDVYVQESGLATTESCQVIKILTDAGTRARTALRQDFDPAANRMTFKQIRVHRQDGTIEEVPVDTVVTQAFPQHGIFWGLMQYILPSPRLEVGDCLEVRISKIGFNIAYLGAEDGRSPAGGKVAVSGGAGQEEKLQPPMPGHWYETTLFQGSEPILNKRYSVHMPKNMPVQYEEYNGALQSSFWFGEKTHILSWWAKDVRPLKREPGMTSLDDNVPKLVMATVPDWPTKSRWFHGVNEKQFEADDAIRAKVKELTDGLPDEPSKIDALLHWVADNVRYYGTTRGPCEGFTLHTGIETFRDRGGVCKDKASMLITMLRVLGIESYPALTMAGPRVEDIPADQFNHTVTCIRNQDGTFSILDPTWSPLSRELWSSWEVKQHLVYGTPEGQGLTLSAPYPPEYSQLSWKAQSLITPEGRLETAVVIDASGSPCTSFRRTIEKNVKTEQKAFLEQALAIAPNARLASVVWTNPYDYSKDTQVSMNVTAADYAAGQNQVRLFRLPMLSRPLGSFIAGDLSVPGDLKERKFPLRLRATRLVRFEETIKLPADWKVDHLPASRKIAAGPTSLKFECSATAGEIKYLLELTLKDNIISPKDYPGFKQAIDALNELADEWIVCRSGAAEKADQVAAVAGMQEVNHD